VRSKEIAQRLFSLFGIEDIVLLEQNTRQLLTLLRQDIAAPRELLLGLEQRAPRCQPFNACPGSAARLRGRHERTSRGTRPASLHHLPTRAWLILRPPFIVSPRLAHHAPLTTPERPKLGLSSNG
jgi:hypothetical protein